MFLHLSELLSSSPFNFNSRLFLFPVVSSLSNWFLMGELLEELTSAGSAFCVHFLGEFVRLWEALLFGEFETKFVFKLFAEFLIKTLFSWAHSSSLWFVWISGFGEETDRRWSVLDGPLPRKILIII